MRPPKTRVEKYFQAPRKQTETFRNAGWRGRDAAPHGAPARPKPVVSGRITCLARRSHLLAAVAVLAAFGCLAALGCSPIRSPVLARANLAIRYRRYALPSAVRRSSVSRPGSRRPREERRFALFGDCGESGRGRDDRANGCREHSVQSLDGATVLPCADCE